MGACYATDSEDAQDAKQHENQLSNATYDASEANGHLYGPPELRRIG